MTKPQDLTFSIYLLCYPDLPTDQRHYIGITTPARLRARMLEHAHGYGARFTKLNHRKRLPFYLARTWETPDPDLEQRLIRHEPKGPLCPRCQGAPAAAYYPHARSKPGSDQSAAPIEYLALDVKTSRGHKTNRKGGRRTGPPPP